MRLKSKSHRQRLALEMVDRGHALSWLQAPGDAQVSQVLRLLDLEANPASIKPVIKPIFKPVGAALVSAVLLVAGASLISHAASRSMARCADKGSDGVVKLSLADVLQLSIGVGVIAAASVFWFRP